MRIFSRLTGLIMAGVVVTTALPIFAAITLVQSQSNELERADALEIAARALVRAETVAKQLHDSARELEMLTPEEACTPKGLDVLRKIDLRSTMLQGIGWVEGNQMRCSSFLGNEPFDLGEPDFLSTLNSRVRTNVTFVDPEVPYLTVQMGPSVGVVHHDMPLSFFDNDVPGLGVGVFSWSNRVPLMSRGDVPPEIYEKAAKRQLFKYHGSLIAVARSDTYDLAAVAVVPPGYSANYTLQATKILIPVGLLIGIVLSALWIYVVRNRLSMPAMIRTALAQNKFYLHYQPMVDLASGRIIGAEALIRWDRGNAHSIPTERLIDAAEEAGLIPLITAHVLKLLVEDARAVIEVLPNFRFSVNLSASDLYRPSILGEVERLIERSGLAPDNLVIEATERSLVDVDRSRATMGRLREMGVRLAIDDFGTGYSSLAYLAQIEADFLKIDKLFVHALGTESATSQVAERIIEMGKDLSLSIVAEGIETKRQERLLKKLGVECGQGFLYGHAMAAEDLLVLLHADRAKYERRRNKLRVVA